MSKVVRSVKNVTKGYSSVQVKVRNGTLEHLCLRPNAEAYHILFSPRTTSSCHHPFIGPVAFVVDIMGYVNDRAPGNRNG